MRFVLILAALLCVPSVVLGQMWFSDLGNRGLHSGNTKNKGVPTQTPSQAPTVTPTPTPTAGHTPTPTPTPTGATPTPTAQPTLDAYGGNASVTCSGGAKSHFYTQKIGDRWWICDPLGNGYFMKAVAAVILNQNAAQAAIIPVKYASGQGNGQSTTPSLNWGLNQVNRFIAWGFNDDDSSDGALIPTINQGTGANGWPNTGGYIPTKLPFSFDDNVTRYNFSATFSGETPIKEQMHGLSASAPAGTTWSFYRGYDYGDYYDSHFATNNALILAQFNGIANPSGTNGSYIVMGTIDEGDQTGGLFVQSSTSWDSFPLIGYDNIQAQAGWLTLNTSPVQTSNSTWYGSNYSDCNNYTKIALVNSLITEYGTIAALNTAWGSSYTTFWSSQSGFTGSSNWGSGHPNCSGYTKYGTGTGIMDEGGQDTFSGDPCTLLSSTSSNFTCSTGYSSSTSSFRADMSTFYKAYLDQYLSVQKTAWNNQFPGILLSVFTGGSGSPGRAEVYTEAAKYMDLVQLGSVSLYGDPNAQSKLDFVENNLGDKPIWNFLLVSANLDSPENACVAGGNTCHYGNPTFGTSYTNSYDNTTQALKGTWYANSVNQLISMKSTTYGDYPTVGFYWWEGQDSDSGTSSWGLVDNQDNPYDGSADTETPGTDTWGYTTGESKQRKSWCVVTGDPVPGCTGSGTASWTDNSLWAGQTACTGSGTPYACCTGSFTGTNAQPCGANYGNFISSVSTTNNGLYANLPP